MASKISAKVVDMTGKEVSTISLDASVWGVEPNTSVMFDAVLVEQNNARQATAKTKVRHEVSGGGKKPWRQKGTGRARAGTTRSPIWVGGGTVFGPDGNQNYKISQNKKEHTLALKSALSTKVKNGLVVVDDIKFAEKKTKSFVAFLDALKVGNKVLVVVPAIDENTYSCSRNCAFAKVVTSDNVSVLDLLNTDSLVMSQDSVKEVTEALK